MKIIICFLAAIATVSAGVIGNAGLGTYSLDRLSASGYTFGSLHDGGLLLSNGAANADTVGYKTANILSRSHASVPEYQTVQLVPHGVQTTGQANLGVASAGTVEYKTNNIFSGSQSLLPNYQNVQNGIQTTLPASAVEYTAHRAPEYRNVHFVPNQQVIQQNSVQFVQPNIQSTPEFGSLNIIKQGAPQIPETRTLQFVSHQPASSPDVKFLNIVHQHPAQKVNHLNFVKEAHTPAPEERRLQTIQYHPEPSQQTKVVNVIHQKPASSPQIKTLQFIEEPHASHVETIRIIHEKDDSKIVQHEGSSVQTFQIIHEGANSEEGQDIKIVKS